jgi:SNF2 family DNA or RNA helicase
MNNYEETQEKYSKISDYQKDLLKVLTLMDSIHPRNKILQVCDKTGIKDSRNRSYTSATLSSELEKLKSMWLVKKSLDQKFQIYPDAFDYILRKALSDKRIKKLHSVVLELLPGINSRSLYNRTSETILRDICFALYTGNYAVFSKAKEYAIQYYCINLNDIYTLFFINRYGEENIPKLAPEFQLEFYQANLKKMLFRLEDISLPLKSINKFRAAEDKETRNFVNQCRSLNSLMKGDWETVRKTWRGDQSVDSWRFRGWMNFAMGNNVKAIENYETALIAYRKEEGSRKSFFRGYHGAIYILALLKQHNTRHLTTITKHFKDIFSAGAANVFILLRAVVESLRNNDIYSEELFCQEYIYYNIDGLLYLYVQYWTGNYAPNWEKYAHTLHHKAKKSGYYWVAYNVAALMETISTDKVEYYKKSSSELHRQIGKAPSLLDIIAIREDWEVALHALETLNGHDHHQESHHGNRMIWLIDFEKEIIQPKIQKTNKSGKWSKGRNASLLKLSEGEIEEATLHDSRIANTISHDLSWLGNGSHGFYDMDKAFKALIGHPLLFLHKSPEVACELQSGKPELIISENENGYEIKSSTNISKVGYCILKETPTRYKYIEITAKLVQLFQVLGSDCLQIPLKGKEKLEKALKSLNPVISIQSDLDFQEEDLPKLESDGRIHIHLLPVGDGFHVEMFVKPFRICPPYFRPGEGLARVVRVVESIKSQTTRNLMKEKELAENIIETCEVLKETISHEGLWQFENPVTCLKLLRDLEPLKLSDRIIIEWPKGEKIKIKQHINFDNLQISIKKENDWFGISGSVKINENLVLDMRQLLTMLQEQKSEFIELDDGQFLALSTQLRKQLNDIDKFTDEEGRISPLAGFALEGLSDKIKDLKVDKEWEDHILKLKTIGKKEYKIPSNLKANLRTYQKEGYQWLSRLADWGVGACLADDMGLGKTVQALALILQRSNQGASLVVAPASVCRNWIKEIEKFSPSLKAELFGDNNRKASIKNAGNNHVIICTYGLLQSESELFSEKQFATIVLDEAQAIKNNTAKRSKAAMKLKGGFKIITTGTPIENHLGELWNLFRFINPGLLGTMKWFRTRFAIPIEKDREEETQEQLQLLIRPFILRRHKKDVLKELPEKTEIVLSVQLSEEEKAFYEALRRDAIDSLENNQEERGGVKHLKVLAQLMRLRRACCNPSLVDPFTKIKGAKLELFGKVVDELIENGHKALVFSQFVGHLRIIESYIKEKGISYQYLDGQTPAKKRQVNIDAFQDGAGELFLISLKAGGTGLNLTAADYVIHMDPWWNPAVEDQASDRAHRIGQTRPVTVYRLITENTIEEKIIKLHESKRDLADSLLKGTDVSSKLSSKDLLELIKKG